MEDKRKDMIEDNEIDHLLQQLYGFSDEQLLRDFKEMEADNTPRPELEPFPDEFDRIWEDIQAERAARLTEEGKEVQPKEAATVTQTPRRRKLKWKRLAAVGLAACFLTLGFCFVAVGKKSYFYRERNRSGNQQDVVFNNDSSIKSVDDQETAYGVIEERLGIKSLRLGYVPAGLAFVGLEVNDRSAVMKFSYEDNTIYFVQSNDLTEASRNMKSDGKPYDVVSNKWLNKQINVKKDRIDTVLDCYEARFTYEDIFCWIYGNIAEEDFMKIIERISY
ncbi:DUF4367 domain-containing protein [Clostridium sp. AF18-27]|uniref:DUF4367 domain-containing protein n=1 Tax=Enterocloster lavalensis TaxID=460384 RepID=UPI000E4C9CC0|nr:DUF4367 domain-containing protein [Enterocloster lavalensis]RHR56099.1 DUF4367 domain-containing protein [Clostridium sp. AF18-27]